MDAGAVSWRAGVVLAAALVVGAAGCGRQDLDKAGGGVVRPVVLTLADPETDISNAEPFASAVAALSHGMVQVLVEGDWRPADPGGEAGLITDVQAGKAQLGITPARAFDAVGITSFQALQAPFLIDSYPLERAVLGGGIPGQMLAGLPAHGLTGLAVLAGPLRRPLGFTRPLVGVASYRGARIAIRPSRVDAAIFRALGAVPVTFYRTPGPGTIAGLTGIESHAAGIDSGQAVPRAVLTGNVVFEPRPSVLFINSRALAALTPRQRAIVSQAAARARSAGTYEGNDAANAADLCRRGITIVSASAADLAGLQAATRPVYRALDADPATRAFITAITALRRAAGGAPGAITCPAASPAATATTAAALQGTWQASYTQTELAAAGDDSSVPAEGNWGHYTLTFRNDHWSQRLLGGDPAVTPNNVLTYGTFIVTGNTITFYRHDHGYVSSDTEVWGPYIWSVYHDTLTFKEVGPPGGFQGPTGLVVKPWRKTGQ